MSNAGPLFKTAAPGVNPDGSLEAQEKPNVALPKASERPVFASKEEELKWIEATKAEIQRKRDLPFLYGWKWYDWARAFYESDNKVNLLCAANQISKSSTQIRKCINWATNQELWPKLWETDPVQFWYLYPTKPQINAEFETKWKLFLPKGKMKDDPYYGWKVEKKHGDIIAIHFNSGVHIYFKSYMQDVQSLQTGTCDAIFCDEELPVHLYEELMFRISSSNGYFHMVFTATLGQEFWRLTMEPGEGEKENLPEAFKQTVSLYDSQKYEDGSPSKWTNERIKVVEARCSTNAEVEKRVHGKFIVIGGRKYESFDIKRHFKPKHVLPSTWLIFAGADIGSGGPDGHPSALCYVAVRPDFRAGRVFLGWRGDFQTTTSGDVVEKHLELKKEHKLNNFGGKYYDWSNKDFDTISTRMGEPFEKAEKGHDVGEDVLNTLFKNNMLYLYEDEELRKLGGELATLKKNENKKKAKDDFADALRYAVTKIPWDWTVITGEPSQDEIPEEKPMNDTERQLQERRARFEEKQHEQEQHRIEDEFDEWNEYYGG